MSLDIDRLPFIYASWRERQVDRDGRHDLIDDVVAGRFEVFDPEEERINPRSPNLVAVGLEDTAEAASLVPTVRVQPYRGGADVKAEAMKQEKIAGSYMDANGMDLMIPRSVMDMAAYGGMVWTVTPDRKERRPLIERRDPRTCYTDPGWRPGDAVKSAFFARAVYFSSLPMEYQEKFRADPTLQDQLVLEPNTQVVLIEYYDETEIVVAALYETQTTDLLFKDTKLGMLPVELDRLVHRAKVCPVVIQARITLDGEWRGQFDQVLGMLDAHIKLMGMVLDYGDQAVYCLAPETPVLTEDLRWVPVGELYEGDRVAGFDEALRSGVQRHWRSASVTATGRAFLPSYRVILEDGTVTVASEDHMWLTNTYQSQSGATEWRRTADLKPGVRAVKVLEPWEQIHTWGSGYLAGMFDGEGYLGRNGPTGLKCGLAQRDNGALDRVQHELKELGFEFTVAPATASDVFNLTIRGGRAEVLRLLGQIRPQRLLDRWREQEGFDLLGRIHHVDRVAVVSVEPLGLQEVVTLATSTGTLVAQGFAHHNSDVWVRDLIGEMPYGGGSFIELGPQGAIGRVPPAVSSLNLQADLQGLMDGIHVGARWPKVRPGEVDQSIASAKFIEASAGMMNTAIRTYHLLLKKAIEQAIRIAFVIDKAWFPKGTKAATGVLRNQEFLVEYKASDINLKNKVRVEYGLGLGRDPAQSAVLHLQYQGADVVSLEFVQENVDGLTDVGREQARVDVQKLRSMIFAKLLMLVEQGAVPDSALVELTRAREAGQDLLKIYEDLIIKPQEEAAAAAVPTGLGAPMQPGGPAMQGPPGMVPGQGPPGLPAGPMPPPPPTGTDLLSRLTSPTAGGGMMGTQVQRNAS